MIYIYAYVTISVIYVSERGLLQEARHPFIYTSHSVNGCCSVFSARVSRGRHPIKMYNNILNVCQGYHGLRLWWGEVGYRELGPFTRHEDFKFLSKKKPRVVTRLLVSFKTNTYQFIQNKLKISQNLLST